MVESGTQAINVADLKLDVRAAMDAGDLEAVAAKLEAAPEAFRRAFPLRMMAGELAERRELLDEAIAIYRQLHADFPDRPSPALKLVRLYLKTDQAAEARELFEAAVWPGSAAPEAKARLLAVLAPVAGPEGADVYLDRLPEAERREPGLLLRVAAAEARAGLREKALERMAWVPGPLSTADEVLRIDVLMKLLEIAEALDHAHRAVAERPDDIELVRKLLELLQRTRQPTECYALLKRVIGRWPDDGALIQRLNGLPITFDQFSELFDIVRAGWDPAKATPRALLQFALAAMQVGDTQAALEALDLIPDDGSCGQPIGALKAVLASRTVEDWDRPSRMDDDLVKQVQVVTRPDARATLVVFSGLGNRFCQLPLSYADVLLADHPVNVIYLRAGPRGYIAGMPGLGNDPASIGQGIGRLAASLGELPLIVMGFSVGGFAAERSAGIAGAKAVISFAGPTAAYSFADKPPEASMAYVRYEAAMVPVRDRDTRPHIAEHPEMKAYHVYGADHPEDSRQALRLQDLPNVELIGLEGVGAHLVGIDAIASGQFDRLLSRILDEVS